MPDIQDTLKRIKTKGYWEVNLTPEKYIDDRFSQKELNQFVSDCAIRISGWTYPHIQEPHGGPYPINRGIEQSCDAFWGRQEIWRMTRSGNFYHIFSIWNDWRDDSEPVPMWSGQMPKGKKWIGVRSSLFAFCEIFEFAKRLAQKNVFDKNLFLSIIIHDLGERFLIVDGIDRTPFVADNVVRLRDPWSVEIKNKNCADFIQETHQLSLNAYVDFVYQFGWKDPPLDLLRSDQMKFLSGKAF